MYLKTQKLKSFTCEENWSETDLILGFYLEEKTDLAAFIKCYNQRNPSELQAEYRGLKVNVTQKPSASKISTPTSTKDFMELYNETLTILSKPREKRDDSRIYTLLKSIENRQNLIARLLESVVYYDYGNQAKAQSIVKEILRSDFYAHVVSSDLNTLNSSQVTEMVLQLFEELKKRKLSKDALETLVFYIHFHSTSELKDRLDREFDIPKGITQVQNKYQKIIYGQELPFVWAPSLYENSSRQEYIRFVRSSLKYKKVTKPSELLLFRSFPSIQKTRKKVIKEIFFKLKESTDKLEQFIYFSLIENETFYRLASTTEKQRLGLVINKKREFLLKVLKDTGLEEFALLSLINIGNIDKKFIENVILSNE